MGFWNKTLLTTSQDGLNFVLQQALLYQDDDLTWYACPAGSTSDGISSPVLLHITESPYGKDRWWSGILHDCSPKYRCTLLQWKDGWEVAQLNFEQCNALIKRALISQGFNPERAEAYYVALQAAGGTASANDLSQSVAHLTLPPPPPNI